ncbi:GNAT family N-acetyltransferase [uncultured Dokdonia sp.]|uniref:GNAT family N-acetyltransferase n=1 Tax=uncultured Dokdonia sp. TaxID=575653 RepID=UPI002614BAE8|nr:GNAT family N-acetyltransferase [uncultured Dokdonia sp.]
MKHPNDFSEFEVIETTRLLLREPRMKDREMLFFMRTAQEVNTYIKRTPPKTLQDIDLFINDRLRDRQKGISIYWVLTLKECPDQCIGAISLWQFSKDRKTAEVGYDLHPDYQGKGYMSEALATVLEFGFHILDLHTIEAYTHRGNIPSRTLLERHKFTLTDKKDDEVPTNRVYMCIRAI